MARPIDPKAVKARIKANKAVMQSNKKVITDYLKTPGDLNVARKALSTFTKAAIAIQADTLKLDALNETKE